MTALILVDLQNDFMPRGALEVKRGDQILPIVNELLKMPFDVIVASMDWHPPHHVSFASTVKKQVGDVIEVKGIPQILWPDHCIQGTNGAQFHSGWDSSKVHTVIHKGIEPDEDSYSTFFDNNHVRDTGLGDYLKKRGIHTLYFAGLTTEYCVKYSVLDAINLGFNVNVVLEGCMGLHPADSQKAVEEMKESGAKVVPLKEISKRGLSG